MKTTGTITKTGNCHMIGLCGAGMSAVAKLLKDQGWRVSGSDAGFYPPISEVLSQAGFRCDTPHHPDNIPSDVDLIVIGKHAKLRPELNEEVQAAFALQEHGQVAVRSFPEVLNELTANTENIVVVGSYGKSTTTALLSWILQQTERDPSFFIGAVPINMDQSSKLGKGRYFVLEGDEYPSSNWDSRPKFLHYNAKAVLLSSCEYDHFNEFGTEDAYVMAYRKLVSGLPEDGLLVACLDGKHVNSVIKDAPCRVVTYSTEAFSEANYIPLNIRHDGALTRFTIQLRQSPAESLMEMSTTLIGKHNLQNIVGAVALLNELNAASPEEMVPAVASFPGLRRRLELKASANGIYVYEDLSSSRPKAMAALSALRERYPQAAITAVFQPHTFSYRSRQALSWYPGMFTDANHVLVLSPPNLKGLKSSEELSHEEIVEAIKTGNACNVSVVASNEDLLSFVHEQTAVKSELVFVVMSSGAVSETTSTLVNGIQA